jgi:hypothetical protein
MPRVVSSVMKAMTLPRGRRGFTSTALAGAALVTASLLLAGCASAKSTTSTVSTAVVASGGIFDRVLDQPSVAATPAGFYVTWQVDSQAKTPSSVLVRADQATGRIEAMHSFSTGSITRPFAVGTSLWAMLAMSHAELLLRMDPVTLAVTGELSVSSGSFQGATYRNNQLSVAGGALWVVGGDRLDRVSLPTMKLTKTITLPGAFSSAIAGSADGSFLIVSEANSGGQGSLQRRDPVTGALLASHPVTGVTAASLGGVVGSGAWIAEPTGMMGYVERVSTATLAPVPGTSVEGSNGIDVAVADGVIWVSQPPGGPSDNYCADPVTGRVLARIPLLSRELDIPIAFTTQYVYYGASANDGYYLRRLAVPAACRA